MSLVSRVEKFHDDNRYFLPVAFIAFILMATGALYLGPVIVNSDIVVNRTLLFKSDAVILSTLLRPGWEFHAEVLANKMVSLSVINLMGETVAFSNSSSIDFKPSFLDLFFFDGLLVCVGVGVSFEDVDFLVYEVLGHVDHHDDAVEDE